MDANILSGANEYTDGKIDDIEGEITRIDQKTDILSGYTDTLLSGVTEDNETVEFYILTKNK